MKVFVTGGSGFLGRALVRTLVARGDTVRALSRSAGADQVLSGLGAEPVRGDLDDTAALKRGLAGCEVAFHAAATVTDWGREEEFLRINVEGTGRVLDAARAAGVRRVVHVSTEAVLVGGPPIRNADESWPLPVAPIGLYPRTKGLAETRVLASVAQGQDAVIVRPRFIWGRGDTTLLPRFVEAVRTGRFAWIGGGRYLTSTCHVDNVVEGMLLAAERGPAGGVYFLTDGPPVEFRRFLTDMLATQGVTPPDRSIPLWLARGVAVAGEGAFTVLPLKGGPTLTRCGVRLMGEEVTVNDRRARDVLGYAGRVGMAEGMAGLREAGPG